MDRTFGFQFHHDLGAASRELRDQALTLFSSSDSSRIAKGLQTATYAHRKQLRSDGSAYVLHPVRTALLAMRYSPNCAPEVVIACLLHDTLEDTDLKVIDVAREFGEVVAQYVLAVTRYRPANESARQRLESKAANWERIMGACQEVRSVKTFDCCDNVLSWKLIKPEMPAYKKIPRWLAETQEWYLPLARITNEHAVRLITTEFEGYLSSGQKVGDLLEG